MRRRGAVLELGIIPEHRQEMFLEPHHQGMNPSVEYDVGALETHLRGIASGKVLDVNRRGNDGARNAEPFRDVAFHLRAEHQLRLKFADLRFDVEIVVGDQGLDPMQLRGLANLAREFTGIGAEADDLEA